VHSCHLLLVLRPPVPAHSALAASRKIILGHEADDNNPAFAAVVLPGIVCTGVCCKKASPKH